MTAIQTIHFAGVDASLRRILEIFAPSIGARLEVHANVEQFLDMHQRNPPECLVLDTGNAVVPSETVLSSLQHNSHRLPVVVASGATNAVLEEQLHDAGIVAFIAVGDPPLIRSAVLASLVISREQEQIRVRMQDFKRRLGNLSVKQLSVLDALVRGGSNKQIAGEFGVSERTLERRRSELISTLNVQSVIEAAWWYGRSSLPAPGQRFRWPRLEPVASTVGNDCESDGVAASPAVLASAGPVQ